MRERRRERLTVIWKDGWIEYMDGCWKNKFIKMKYVKDI